MATLADLQARFAALPAQIEQRASAAAVEVAVNIVDTLAHNTPVDTSQALSSWLATLDAPSTGYIEGGHFPGSHGSTRDQSAAKTVADAREHLNIGGPKQPGQTIYITNNQPYIRVLDAGTHSKQPGNFVALALQRARRFIRSTRFNLLG